jgi:Nif-specific regulatory protein
MDRAEQELDILEEVSQILGETLELSEVFQRAMRVLTHRLGFQRAALVLLDRSKDQLRTIAAVGLTPAEQDRGRYAIGEGVTGKVMATGQPAVIPDIAKHPNFLNRTQSRPTPGNPAPGSPGTAASAAVPHGAGGGSAETGPLSFICVPIREGDQVVGTISVDKPFESTDLLDDDARLIRIIARLFAQAVRIHHLIQLERDEWLAETEQLRSNLRQTYKFDNIIGSSPVMLDVLGTIAQVASSRATVLILGETGCGKELIAKAIHYNSPRRDKPLIRVNCGALSPQLLESELFGHVKGAFTGAVKDKIGRFEAADGGTLFLDEIGTLDAQLQVKLLRVLQEREFERVGDHHTIRTDVRVIAATNLDLEQEVRKSNFREDLYYRLNVVTIHLPPLRSRREDIPMLIDHFLDRYNRENQRELRKISRDTLNTLLRYPWPGNVRELENTIERAVVLSNGEDFTDDLLPLSIRLFAQQTRTETTDESIEGLTVKLADHAVKQYAVYEGKIYEMVISQVEKHLIKEALDYNAGVKIRAADFLGINRNTLNKKVKDLEIEALD